MTPKSKSILGHVQSCLLKSNRLCLFLSFIYICIQKIKVRRESIRSRDIDDYRIVLCSWNYPQFQLRLRLLFDFSKKKINSQKLIWSFLIFEEYTPKCTENTPKYPIRGFLLSGYRLLPKVLCKYISSENIEFLNRYRNIQSKHRSKKTWKWFLAEGEGVGDD